VNAPLTHPFDTEAAYRAAIDVVLTAARSEIRIFDRDLLQMALGKRERVALLADFLAGGRDRRLCIVLHDIAPLERFLPRLIELMRLRGHMIETRKTPDNLRNLTDCWLLADGAHGAIRFHVDHPRGKLVTDLAPEIEPWWRRFDDLWQECEMCTPGATTGL